MSGLNACTDQIDCYRDSAAIEIARFDSAAIPGNLADAMKNSVVWFGYDFYPFPPIVPICRPIPTSEIAANTQN
ncbi:MAG: hypothetical protein OXG88_07485 [Gammaproteobacteria bacterium]|nr:hypothetical protein [Gammaproteobacteria bacterium]